MTSSTPRDGRSLAALHPELATQAVGWDPTTVTAGSHKKMKWRCDKGHEWIATVAPRALRGVGCPICTRRQVLAGENDLATTHPDLAREAIDWDPTTVTTGSGRKKRWRCDKKHEWIATVAHRALRGVGCPICSNQQVLAGENDLATTHPDLAREAVDWDPTTVTAGSGKKKRWRCNKNHEWTATVGNRALKGTGCPICSNQQVLAGENDLATTHPDLAREAVDWDPTTVTAGIGKKKRWRCDKNHEWTATVGHRTLNGSGCPICSNQQALVGENDLATTHPDLAREAVGWDPTTVTAGSGKKKRWRCNKNHEWTASVGHRAFRGQACPSCATYGFDPNLPSWLYFIEHDGWEMLQIGITNYPKDRLGLHARRGWETLEIRGPMDGSLTRALETDILKSLVLRGALLASNAGGRSFDGWTEAWTRLSLPVTSLKEMLEFVYADDQ